MNPFFIGFRGGKRINGDFYIKRHGEWFRLSMLAKWQAESIKGS
ncbi:hypothetical protein QNH38_07950 [Paenibacillus polymyxa]|nr:hypothetical protein [Paenibacillus polymyxa]WHX37363.1 hypothetical protein QNH38_07950 [Paenibacillus polymyxa]